jgi:hypothetical protein
MRKIKTLCAAGLAESFQLNENRALLLTDGSDYLLTILRQTNVYLFAGA